MTLRIGSFAPAVPVLALREIDGRCQCTWVVTEYRKNGQSGSSLKYRNVLCPAVTFHRTLEGREPT